MYYIGYLDVCSPAMISGWAFDAHNPQHPINVDIYVSDSLVATVPAGGFRQDLQDQGIGNGCHAFEVPVAAELSAGNDVLINVRFAGTRQDLFQSPAVIAGQGQTKIRDTHNRRRVLSLAYLQGEGVEIGALHFPLPVGSRAHVRYLDRMTVADLRLQYPELEQAQLTPVDIIDDGEKLLTIADGSLDFIICNHMLEHCANPLGTMRQHLRKLKDEGVLYCAVPDKRFTFDVDRPLTSFDHLMLDDRDDGASSRYAHFVEFVEVVQHPGGKETIASVQELLEMDYSIHYHVWDCSSFMDFLVQARNYLGRSFEVVHFERNHDEAIAILIKRSP